jgi:sulfur transfer complex TusBCD TusB component (DsrH family)
VLKRLYFNIKIAFREMGCDDVKLIQDGVHVRLIHTCHAAPLPFSDSAVFFVKVCVVARNIPTASPTV